MSLSTLFATKSLLCLSSSLILLLMRPKPAHGLASVTPNNKPQLWSVGLAAVDFVATVDHFPDPDEKMRSSQLLVQGGGNAANTACAVGRLGFVQSKLVTAVGDDANGNTILSGLADMNVIADETTIERFEGSSPFTYILVAPDMTRTCIHQPASGDMSVAFVEQLDLSEASAVHFDVRYPAAAVELGKRCQELSIPYSVDVERPRDGLTELMADATVVICNSDYCNNHLGEEKSDDVAVVADRLRQVVSEQAPNAKIAVQTLGSQGSCLVRMPGSTEEDMDTDDDDSSSSDGARVILETDDDDSNVPTVTLQDDGALLCTAFGGCNVVDTTGAGDSFQGGFLTALWAAAAAETAAASQQEVDGGADNDDNKAAASSSSPLQPPMDSTTLAHALRVATRVAAKKVEQPGARSGLPWGDQDEFIQAEMKAITAAAAVAAAATAADSKKGEPVPSAS